MNPKVDAAAAAMNDKMTDRVAAAVDMLRRTGIKKFSLRYQEDDTPTVWIAVGTWEGGHVAGVGFTPDNAALDLLERTIDGGRCNHCQRQTVVIDGAPEAEFWSEIERLDGCIYWYDADTKRYRRDCEGHPHVDG